MEEARTRTIEKYLELYGSYDVREIIDAFDLKKAVYEKHLDVGEDIFQFVRRPSFDDPAPILGSWFCLKGASLDRLAIISGGAGRIVSHLQVERSRMVARELSGTAR